MGELRLLLDAGGVLVNNGTVDELLSCFPADRDRAWQVWRQKIRELLWRGLIDVDVAIVRLGGLLGPRLCEVPDLTPSLLPWAREAVEIGYARVAVLSNHRHEWLLPALDPLRGDLDAVFVSSLIGECKPSPAAFLKACALWHCRPDEVVFVDDQIENLAAAEKLGMRTVRANPESRSWIDAVRHIGGRL